MAKKQNTKLSSSLQHKNSFDSERNKSERNCIKYPAITLHPSLSPQEFFSSYVGKKPVVIKGLLKDIPAIKKWKSPYLKKVSHDATVKVKIGNPKQKKTQEMKFSDYLDYVGSDHPLENKDKLYLHDFRLLPLLPCLKKDLLPFPLDYISKWYHKNWWENTLFFWAKSSSVTTMHFDILGAHNLFFHLQGRKKFTILDKSDHKFCYLYDYNHSPIDPRNPDFETYPQFRKASPYEVTLEPGDVFYMPPYTLHYVESLDNCVSFNIDWHTRKSVLAAIFKLLVRKKYALVYCNIICALGLFFNISPKKLYTLYKKYYEYL